MQPKNFRSISTDQRFLGPVGLKPNAKPLEDGLTVIVDNL